VSKKRKKTKEEKAKNPSVAQPWISMHTGLKIITVASIAMAVLTAWQVIPSKGWLEGILWGLLFGVLIWAIFLATFYLTDFYANNMDVYP